MAPWAIAHQAPLSMGFPREKYGSGLLFPSLGDYLDPGVESESSYIGRQVLYYRANQGIPAASLNVVISCVSKNRG